MIGTDHHWTEADKVAISPRRNVTILAGKCDIADWPRFLEAVALEALGLQREADKAADRFEASMGVTQDDRILAGAVAIKTRPTDDELLTVARAEAHIAQARTMALPTRIRRGEMGHEVKKLRTTKRNMVLNAKASMARVEAAISRRRDQAEEVEIRRGLVETARLAANRDDAVSVSSAGRRVRVERMSGLERAYRRDFLANDEAPAEMLYRTGVTYRDKFEMSHGRKNNRAEPGQGGSRAVSPRIPVKEIEAGAYLSSLRRHLSYAEQVVLEAVCGEDRSIGETARTTHTAWSTVQKHLVSGLKKILKAEKSAPIPLTREKT